MKVLIEIAMFSVCVLLFGHVMAINNPTTPVECRK